MKTILLSLFAALMVVSIGVASGKTGHKAHAQKAAQTAVAQQPATTPSGTASTQTVAKNEKKPSGKATMVKHSKSKKTTAMKHSKKHWTKKSKSAASGTATKNEKTEPKQ